MRFIFFMYTNSMSYNKNLNGFTFIQLMVSIGIAGILLAVAIPNFSKLMNSAKLEKASESFTSHLMWAKSKSNSGSDIYMSITDGTNWCFGFSSTAGCNCNTSGSCGYLAITSADYSGISLTNNSGITNMEIPDNSGTISSTLQLTFTNGDGISIIINKNQAGLITVCSDNIPHYSGC